MSSATLQSLIYALIQIIHNFGAVFIVGTSAYGTWQLRREMPAQRRTAFWLSLFWALQAVSGAAFGATSYYFYGHLPDIHGVAIDALSVKIACASAGFLTAALYYQLSPRGWFRSSLLIWVTSLILGCIALSSAAFLRWFS